MEGVEMIQLTVSSMTEVGGLLSTGEKGLLLEPVATALRIAIKPYKFTLAEREGVD